MHRFRSGLSGPLPWFLLLWLAALALALTGLGSVPLRDWDEAIVARVSLEISRNSWPDALLPTYLGRSYLNKPPGLHLAIAGAIRLWQAVSGSAAGSLPPEWVVRLVPALGSSLLVPLLGLVQARLRPGRPGAAVATAVIALTLLPLARHGRLAMLDGTQLSAMALVWLGLLLSGRSARSALAGGLLAGVGASLLLLLKAPVALPVLAGALLLRNLDRAWGPRSRRWLIGGLLLGLLPGLGWHGWHLAARGNEALVMWGAEGMARLIRTVNGNGGGPLIPLTQLVAGGWPWLPLLPFGLARAWRERTRTAGRWTLGLALLACLLVLPLRTQLPWYSLLLWPPFALACGPVLADLASGARRGRLAVVLGRLWASLGAVLLAAIALALLLPGELLPARGLACGLPGGLGLLFGGWQLARSGTARHPTGAVRMVAAGWFLSLLLLFAGPLWNWELSEQPPIAPALALAGHGGARVHLLEGDVQSQRPSLHWYLDSPSAPLDEQTARWPRQRFQLLAQAVSEELAAEKRCAEEESGGDGWRRWECREAGS